MSESVILVLGVSGSGKTCLIRRIQDPDTQDFGSVETVGAQPSKVGNFTFLEVGGQLLPLWHTYAQDAKGIIFVLDVKKTNQIAEAAMAVLDLKATCSIPIILYIRSATSFRNARMHRAAICLSEFDFILEEKVKNDVNAIFKFCHQTNKV